jgi:hypothetical protein
MTMAPASAIVSNCGAALSGEAKMRIFPAITVATAAVAAPSSLSASPTWQAEIGAAMFLANLARACQ